LGLQGRWTGGNHEGADWGGEKKKGPRKGRTESKLLPARGLGVLVERKERRGGHGSQVKKKHKKNVAASGSKASWAAVRNPSGKIPATESGKKKPQLPVKPGGRCTIRLRRKKGERTRCDKTVKRGQGTVNTKEGERGEGHLRPQCPT